MKTNTAVAAALLALIFVAATASAQSLIIYPARGQSQGQHDPLALAEQASQPAPQAAQAPVGGARQRQAQRYVKSQLATFNRAYSACLEGRGYTVK